MTTLHGGVRTNAESQGQNRDGGETWLLQQHADGVAQMSHELINLLGRSDRDLRKSGAIAADAGELAIHALDRVQSGGGNVDRLTCELPVGPRR